MEKKIMEVVKSWEKDNNNSRIIKELYVLGLEIGEIRDCLEKGGIRKRNGGVVSYNNCWNVVDNYCLVNDLEKRKSSGGDSKKSIVIEMLNEGMEVKDISKKLKMNSNYVYGIRKKKEIEDLRKEVEELKKEKEVVSK